MGTISFCRFLTMILPFTVHVSDIFSSFRSFRAFAAREVLANENSLERSLGVVVFQPEACLVDRVTYAFVREAHGDWPYSSLPLAVGLRTESVTPLQIRGFDMTFQAHFFTDELNDFGISVVTYSTI